MTAVQSRHLYRLAIIVIRLYIMRIYTYRGLYISLCICSSLLFALHKWVLACSASFPCWSGRLLFDFWSQTALSDRFDRGWIHPFSNFPVGETRLLDGILEDRTRGNGTESRLAGPWQFALVVSRPNLRCTWLYYYYCAHKNQVGLYTNYKPSKQDLRPLCTLTLVAHAVAVPVPGLANWGGRRKSPLLWRNVVRHATTRSFSRLCPTLIVCW